MSERPGPAGDRRRAERRRGLGMRGGIAALWAVLLTLLSAAPVRLLALIAAAPPLTAFAWWLSHVVARGPWSDERQEQQLNILGNTLTIAMLLIGVVVIALAAVKVSAETKLGVFRVEGDEPDDRLPPAA